jgi:hypothetical protein
MQALWNVHYISFVNLSIEYLMLGGGHSSVQQLKKHADNMVLIRIRKAVK